MGLLARVLNWMGSLAVWGRGRRSAQFPLRRPRHSVHAVLRRSIPAPLTLNPFCLLNSSSSCRSHSEALTGRPITRIFSCEPWLPPDPPRSTSSPSSLCSSTRFDSSTLPWSCFDGTLSADLGDPLSSTTAGVRRLSSCLPPATQFSGPLSPTSLGWCAPLPLLLSNHHQDAVPRPLARPACFNGLG